MERSHLETKQDWWVDTENESRPEGKTWHYIVVTLGLCFLPFNWGEWRQGGGHLKLDIQGQEGRRSLDVVGQEGGVLKIAQFSLTSYVSCPLPLILLVWMNEWKWIKTSNKYKVATAQ